MSRSQLWMQAWKASGWSTISQWPARRASTRFFGPWPRRSSHWGEWNSRIDGDIVQTQIRDGELKGSWEPAGGCTRLTTTALRVLTLEAYYRYSRLVR